MFYGVHLCYFELSAGNVLENCCFQNPPKMFLYEPYPECALDNYRDNDCVSVWSRWLVHGIQSRVSASRLLTVGQSNEGTVSTLYSLLNNFLPSF